MRSIAMAIIGMAIVAAACTSASSSPGPNGAGGGKLTGQTWLLASYASGGTSQAVPAGVVADAVFARTTVSGSTGCNAYNGPYQASGSSLRVGPVAATEIACTGPAADVEAAFFDGLGKTTAYTATADTLTMIDQGGAPTLVFKTGPAGTLSGVTWHLTAYNTGTGAVQSIAAGSDPTAVFGTDGSLTGNASCNSYQGRYVSTARTIKIGPLTSTRLACSSSDLSAQETAYLTALGNVVTWSVQGTELELRDADGSLQAQYVTH